MGKRKIVRVKIDAGIKCATCKKRYLNPFTHVCKVKFGQTKKGR